MTPTTFSRSQEAALVNPTRILVATDLTDYEYLVPHAVGQARASGARVTLIHAILPADAFPTEAGYAPYVPIDDQGISDRAVQLDLEKIAHLIELEGIACDVLFKHGFAADVIREKIEYTRATRLIMGSHGRGKWGRLALGSVANELLGSVSIPVFVIGPQALHSAHQASPQRILHPVSLIGNYRRSFDIALDLAESYKAELTLLHVLDRDVEESVNSERTLAWTENALMSLIPPDSGRRNHTHARAVCGTLVEETLKAAIEIDADWIVLGVDGGFPYLPFQNSAAYRVITAAKCGVLTVRHDPNPTGDEEVRELHLAGTID